MKHSKEEEEATRRRKQPHGATNRVKQDCAKQQDDPQPRARGLLPRGQTETGVEQCNGSGGGFARRFVALVESEKIWRNGFQKVWEWVWVSVWVRVRVESFVCRQQRPNRAHIENSDRSKCKELKKKEEDTKKKKKCFSCSVISSIFSSRNSNHWRFLGCEIHEKWLHIEVREKKKDMRRHKYTRTGA
jgi:hypothetical protein